MAHDHKQHKCGAIAGVIHPDISPYVPVAHSHTKRQTTPSARGALSATRLAGACPAECRALRRAAPSAAMTMMIVTSMMTCGVVSVTCGAAAYSYDRTPCGAFLATVLTTTPFLVSPRVAIRPLHAYRAVRAHNVLVNKRKFGSCCADGPVANFVKARSVAGYAFWRACGRMRAT